MKNQQFEPENQIHWKMIRKEIPENSHQLFLPLYLTHPAALKLRSYGIFMSGISEVGEGFRITRSADFHVVIFTVSGGAVFHTEDGKTTQTASDTVTLIPAGLEHDYSSLPDNPWHFFWFHLVDAPVWSFLRNIREQQLRHSHAGTFLLEAMNGFVAEIGLFSPTQPDPSVPYFYVDSPLLQKSMREFNLSLPGNDWEDAEIAGLYAELIWRHLRRELRDIAGKDEYPSMEAEKLGRLWDEITRKPELPWTLPQMAARMNMSISTFLRCVRRIYDRTPLDIITHIRMRQAARLLQETALPVMNIATRCGYESTSSFVTVFRRNFHDTPLSYRKRHNSGS